MTASLKIDSAVNPIRLLVLDVDGTLVTDDKRMLPEVKAAVREAVAAGLDVALATGRMYPAVRHWIEELGLRTPQICNNGADIVDPLSGRFLLNLVLDSEIATRVLAFGREAGVTLAAFSGPRVLAPVHTSDHYLIERNNEHVEVIPENDFYGVAFTTEKLLFLDQADPLRLERLRDQLQTQFNHTGPLPFSVEITEPGILNVCHPQACKAEALRQLCRILALPLTAVAAVGDSDNDAGMLAAAGLGIAMGNATPSTLAQADVVVPDNEHAGVVIAIRKYVMQQELTDAH